MTQACSFVGRFASRQSHWQLVLRRRMCGDLASNRQLVHGPRQCTLAEPERQYPPASGIGWSSCVSSCCRVQSRSATIHQEARHPSVSSAYIKTAPPILTRLAFLAHHPPFPTFDLTSFIMGFFGENHYDQYQNFDGSDEHKAKFSHEVLGGAAAFAAAKGACTLGTCFFSLVMLTLFDPNRIRGPPSKGGRAYLARPRQGDPCWYLRCSGR